MVKFLLKFLLTESILLPHTKKCLTSRLFNKKKLIIPEKFILASNTLVIKLVFVESVLKSNKKSWKTKPKEGSKARKENCNMKAQN